MCGRVQPTLIQWLWIVVTAAVVLFAAYKYLGF